MPIKTKTSTVGRLGKNGKKKCQMSTEKVYLAFNCLKFMTSIKWFDLSQ